jgi:hypothetical protein
VKKLTYAIVALFATLALSSAGVALAQDEQTDETAKADKTGTNPINFQRDIRVYNEFTWLNVPSGFDGSQNVTTVEYRTPFAGGKWQWRVRGRFSTFDVDDNVPGGLDISESGLGDFDMRFLTVPIVNMEKRHAFAFGLEVFLNTASEDILGLGATSLGPQAFYVKFLPRGLFAPGLQYKFSIDEDAGRRKVDQFLIDLNYLRMGLDKQSWFFTDPQIVIDNEINEEYAIVDFEWGWMMSKWKPDLKGHSFYIRPSVGVGADRLTDGSIEFGYKIVGW